MRRFSSSVLAACAASALILSGCTSGDGARGGGSSSKISVVDVADGASPFAASAAPAGITDDTIEGVGEPRYTVSYPVVDEAKKFNASVKEFVDTRSKQAAGTAKPDPAATDAPSSSSAPSASAGGEATGGSGGVSTSSPAGSGQSTESSQGGGTSMPSPSGQPQQKAQSYTLNWAVTKNAADHVSFLFRDQTGDSGEQSFTSMVLNRKTGEAQDAEKLFTEEGRGKLAAAVLTGLKDNGRNPSVKDAGELSAEQLQTIAAATTLDGKGGLAAHLAPGVLTPADSKPVAVEIPGDETDGFLSEDGKAWLGDAGEGKNLADGEKMPKKVKRKFPDVDCSQTKCVALTFDDGPGPETGKLLDDLAKAEVPATFFMLGTSMGGHEDFMKRMVDEGHELGSHTWDHKQLTKLSKEKAAEEVKRADDRIEEITGQRPTVFRPPYGAFKKGMNSDDLPVIIWSVDTNDWRSKNAEKTKQEATKDVRPGDIILMHDIHSSTVQAVPGIIEKLKADGFTMVTVDQLFGGELEGNKSYYSDQRMEGSRHIPGWAG